MISSRERKITTMSLAWASICAKPYRSLGLAAVVAVSAFVMFGGWLISASLGRGMASLGQRLGADLMVVPQGYDSSMQTALLRGEPSSFYLPEEVVDRLRSLPGIAKVVPQLYLATLDDPCCAYPIQIIGYDTENDFVIAPWMETNHVVSPKGNDIVVGHLIASPIGTKTFFFGDLFRVSARLDRTGMGFDTSIFMTIDRARQLLRECQSELLQDAPERSVSSILVKLDPDANSLRVISTIRKALGKDHALDIVASQDLVSGLSSQIASLITPLRIITVFLWLGSLSALCLFYSVLTGERRRELALLRVLGASRNKINNMVMLESVLLGGGGAAAGLVAAMLFCIPFQALILQKLGLPYLAIPVSAILHLAGVTLLIGTLTGPAACLYAVVRQSRREIFFNVKAGEY